MHVCVVTLRLLFWQNNEYEIGNMDMNTKDTIYSKNWRDSLV